MEALNMTFQIADAQEQERRFTAKTRLKCTRRQRSGAGWIGDISAFAEKLDDKSCSKTQKSPGFCPFLVKIVIGSGSAEIGG